MMANPESWAVRSDPGRSEGAGRAQFLDLGLITESVSRVAERRSSRSWLLLFTLCCGLAIVLLASLTHLVRTGIGVWGNNQTVAWAWDIAGFVFWIGIGHAGTLISAILFLLRQKWRTSVSRAAEAITLFAVVTAAIYPLFHMGRVWLAYWLLPLPNQMGIWPNFKSPLIWDVFAVTSYLIVSILFWYMGLVPDLATLRDRAVSPTRRRLLAVLSLGWCGSQRHYVHYEKAYLILAGLATPLVISVHSVVSFDFAVSVVPGWHSTIFPPYFVAGAIFSGCAMVVLLMIFVRRALRFESFITIRHLEAMNKLVLATGTMLAYSYAVELLMAAQGNDPYEKATIIGRLTGPYAPYCWLMLGCNVLLPQLYWSRKIRTNVPGMLVISVVITVGMWLERFVIIVTGQHRGALPATWFDFHPTLFDASTFLGTFGLFLTLFVLFVRFVPVLSMSEVKGLSSDAAHPIEQSSAMAEDQAEERTEPEHSQHSGVHAGTGLEPLDNALLVGSFQDPTAVVRACEYLTMAGATKVDAYAPYPAHGLKRALRTGASPLPWLALLCGLVGGALAFCAQWWMEAIDYPARIGGKAPGAWQAYVPVTFEVTVLSAALGTFFGLWLLCGLPRLANPIFKVGGFRRATDDRFLVTVEGSAQQCRRLATQLVNRGALEVSQVSL